MAHGGTILLDEISEISPVVQSKLLRVLQERELERVGGMRTINVDVRVIATTNRDLTQSVERKEFRQDLFFRLNVVPIHVPPLRERQPDIQPLAETFMRRYAKKHGCPVAGFSKSSLDALQSHPWPGNIRELQNVVERAVILTGEGALIEPELLGLTVMSSGKIYIPAKTAMQSGRGKLKNWVLEFITKDPSINPLMGWETSTDTLEEVILKFPSKEKAIEYAEKNNISYNVVEPNKKEFVIKSYADNFIKD